MISCRSLFPGHGEAADALSSCSSLSSVHSSSPASDVDRHHRRVRALAGQQPRRSIDRMMDSMDSGGRVGENVYSRIKESGMNLILAAFRTTSVVSG